MKRRLTAKFLMLASMLAALLLINACSDSQDIEEPTENIIPERFGLDVPSSLKSGSSQGRISSTFETSGVSEDNIDGKGVYELLRYFIFLGEASSKIVQGIIFHIATLQIYEVTSLSYISDDDDREKNLDVFEGGSYDGQSYEYSLLLTDIGSQDNDDGGIALRVYWNRSPIKGVAVMVPYNLDREETPEDNGTVYRIDYDETGSSAYEATMTVAISSLPLEDPEEDPFSVNHLKMFVGRSGDTLDIYGNSNHPNATLFNNDEAGINWAFTASGIHDGEVGVAEVGLPPNTLNSTSREDILVEYGVRSVLTNVFVDALNQEFPNVETDVFEQLLDSLLV
ncbi:MAG: hypothetical protein AAGA85_15305, partial [Bacteroidota bacterium]